LPSYLIKTLFRLLLPRVVQKREMTHSHINESDVIGREHDKQKKSLICYCKRTNDLMIG
jgi:hypothetical protein